MPPYVGGGTGDTNLHNSLAVSSGIPRYPRPYPAPALRGLLWPRMASMASSGARTRSRASRSRWRQACAGARIPGHAALGTRAGTETGDGTFPRCSARTATKDFMPSP